jgi:hypothetical protein
MTERKTGWSIMLERAAANQEPNDKKPPKEREPSEQEAKADCIALGFVALGAAIATLWMVFV